MKKVFNSLLAMALLLSFAACTEHAIVPENNKLIGFTPFSSLNTKAPVVGTTLPADVPLYVSAFHNNDANSENYFTGVTFNNEGTVQNPSTKWASNPPRYWPIAGTLNFLVFGTKATPSNVVWGDPNAAVFNAASKVSFTMGDNYRDREDLLYGAKNFETFTANGNQVSVSHAYALLVFKMLISDEADNYRYNDNQQNNVGLEIVSAKVKNLYFGGEVTITNTPGNNPAATAAWTAPLLNQHTTASSLLANSDATGNTNFVPQTLEEYDNQNPIDYTTAGNYFGDSYLVIPPQTRANTELIIEYKIHNGISNGNQETKEMTFNYDFNPKADPSDPDLTWAMGYKYIYEILFTLHKITIAPGVVDWAPQATINVGVEAQ